MHQIRRIITVAQLHVCRPVLLDVRGIVRVFEVFVQLLGLKLAVRSEQFSFKLSFNVQYQVPKQMIYTQPMQLVFLCIWLDIINLL